VSNAPAGRAFRRELPIASIVADGRRIHIQSGSGGGQGGKATQLEGERVNEGGSSRAKSGKPNP
jgi:hypothetical protein